MKLLCICILLIFAALASDAFADNGPKFKEYPARIYIGPEAPLNLDTDEKREFSRQIESASRNPINFGGEYIFASWKTGPDSIYGAVISTKTGDVVLWPFPVCCWGKKDKPFYIKKDSRLIVFSGMLTEEGSGGVHYFEFKGGEFRLLSSPDIQAHAPTEPSAGPTSNAQLPENNAAFHADPATKLLFTKYLLGAMVQASFKKNTKELADKIPLDMIQSFAGAMLSTSVRSQILVDTIKYDLFYNRIADIFIIAKYDGDTIREMGMVTASKVSEDVYGVPNEANYFNLMFKQRPALFKRLAADFREGQSPDKLFSRYVFDEVESYTLKAQLLAGLQFIALGRNDLCTKSAVVHLKSRKLTYGGVPSDDDIYIPMGLLSPEGVVLGFADRATNRHFGYFIYKKSDSMCKPTKILTSTF